MNRRNLLTTRALLCLVGGLNLTAWAALFVIAPQRDALLELGTVAYFLGLRHGFDADHIAAIDNVTRKLRQDQQPSSPSGFFFALGHSTIVIVITLAVVLAVSQHAQWSEAWAHRGALIGPLVSAVFLTLIGLFNLVALIQLGGAFRVSHTSDRHQEIDRQMAAVLDRRGIVARMLRFIYRRIDAGWKMYFVGLLFGLGFDTATEIALLALSAGAAAHARLPVWTIMILPAMFTAGMALVDTLDGVMMARVYEWADDENQRKLLFNIAVTALTVLAALSIGAIEWMQVIASALALNGRFWTWVNAFDFTRAGLLIVASIAAVWLGAWWTYHRRLPRGA
ncbi:MAG: HoxN/HupN/NixA family nickel/cobalt transporter [Candidatus Binataceae bacterium]